MTAGRPPKYKTPQALQKKIDEYFDHCKETGEIPLQGALAYYLGFCSKNGLNEQIQRGHKFSVIVKGAKLRCENALNQAALNGKANALIAKLNLASSYGYSEKQEIEHSGGGLPVTINVNGISPK